MRLYDLSIVIIATVVGTLMLAGYVIKKWQPTTEEGKLEKEVIEEVIDDILLVEEPKL